ncbi:MAG TPA: family 20 glycosylhydrolase [Cyclobacteriaceae bacterium]|nr:family 20 glycosylhydrolase [Cyclobacteriaceae bacterium]
MKYTAQLLALIALVACSCKPSEPPTDLSGQVLIPKPVSILASGSTFNLDQQTKVYFNGTREIEDLASGIARDLSLAETFPSDGASPEEGIFIALTDTSTPDSEGYELTIGEDLIIVSAASAHGIFNGLQTLRQLCPEKVSKGGAYKIPTGVIKDYPRFEWRGTMLDVARHFFSVGDVKRYIDLISAYKMNILHLHLSDDQGWRIEIKSWPNLATQGGSTQVGGGKGGYYTQEQYTEIVEYAAQRFVTIVPEIDLPGHINSALASYGELNGGTIVPVEGAVAKQTPNILGQKNKPTSLYTGTDVGWSTLRYEKEATFKFVNDVIREISAITSGPYFHIGGDEAAATRKEDYIKFINRFVEITAKNGKTMVGWEEIAQGDINTSVITQHWRQQKYALEAVDKGSRLIMSPATKAYIDMSYDSTTKLGLHWAAYIEVDSAYMWDPETQVKGIPKENIIGVEAPLWTETITNMDEIEYMAFPRLPGYAEIGWSPASGRNWDEYKQRLAAHGKRMEALGINFYRSPKVPWK